MVPMLHCLSELFRPYIEGFIKRYREGLEFREVYIDEALYMVDREGRRLTPPKLYMDMGSSISISVARRPVYGIYMHSRSINRVIKLLSSKHNILSLDLTLLQVHGEVSKDFLGRYCDVALVSSDLAKELDADSDESISIEWLFGAKLMAGEDPPIILSVDEDPVHALATYLYGVRPILSLLGEWVLLNPVRAMDGCGEDVGVEAVRVDGSPAEGIEDLYGFVVRCGGICFLELV